MADAAAQLAAAAGGDPLYDLALEVETTATRLLEKAKPGRNLRTNAEFFTAILLHQLGIAAELFSAVFAISRMAGWLAHCKEQQGVDRIFRPTSEYHGPDLRQWVPVADR
jgi:citrate synthase